MSEDAREKAAEARRYDPDDRHETPTERLDRNWSELLQELRVTQTGVQILTGFLLTLPFQQRFADLDRYQRVVYLVAVVLAVCATALLVAPVASHRIFFQQHEKAVLVLSSNVLAKVGLSALAAALATVLLLVFDVVVGRGAGIVVAFVAVVVLAFLWLALPIYLLHKARRQDGLDGADASRR